MTAHTGEQNVDAVAPPRWAAALLPLLLAPDDAETVLGDLIEEYREAILPSIGERRANHWFVREVAGIVCRGPLVWGLLVGASLAGRFALDTFAPPTDYALRSFVTTWSSIVLYLLAGAWGARQAGHARAGVIVALTAHAIGWSANALFTGALFVGVIRHEPAMRSLFEQTGGWGEQWLLPLMLVPFVLVLGSVGGMFGRSLARWRRV
jgi:hypothetical protein